MRRFKATLANRLGLVLISGLLTYPAIKLDSLLTPDRYPPVFSWWMILHGVLFGALVLAPFVSHGRFRALRIVTLVFASVLSYYIAIEIAGLRDFQVFRVWIQYTIAGVSGAVLVATATRFVAPLVVHANYWLYTTLAGLIGGALFSVTAEVCFWDDCRSLWQVLAYSSGWVIWQGLVFGAMYASVRRSPDSLVSQGSESTR